MTGSPLLLSLCRRRWCLPALAELARADAAGMGGAKFVTLCHRLGASEGAVREALQHLIELGCVARNTGHGHPLRPEYILTRKGERAAPACRAADDVLTALGLREVGLKRWSLPAVRAAGRVSPAGFGDLAGVLRTATPRALSHALRDLGDAGLLIRRVEETQRPLRPVYLLSEAGGVLSVSLEPLWPG